MDIQNLKVFVSELELQELAAKFQPADAPVKNLAVKVTPDGVHVGGEVQTPMMPVSFDSVWRPTVVGGRVSVELAGLSAGPFPANPFRALVLGFIKEAIKEPFIEVTDDAIIVDVQDLVKRQDVPVRVVFDVMGVQCVQGGLVAEAGLPGAPPTV